MYKTLIAIFFERYETSASLVHEAIPLVTFTCSACSENKGEKKKPKEEWKKEKQEERKRTKKNG